MTAAKRRFSAISTLHLIRLGYRSALFLTAVAVFVVGRVKKAKHAFFGLENNAVILRTIWILFFIEMLCRFFPFRFESMGAQKQFASNYKPKELPPSPLQKSDGAWKRTLAAAISWLMLNAIIGACYLAGWISSGILLLICLVGRFHFLVVAELWSVFTCRL